MVIVRGGARRVAAEEDVGIVMLEGMGVGMRDIQRGRESELELSEIEVERARQGGEIGVRSEN